MITRKGFIWGKEGLMDEECCCLRYVADFQRGSKMKMM